MPNPILFVKIAEALMSDLMFYLMIWMLIQVPAGMALGWWLRQYHIGGKH